MTQDISTKSIEFSIETLIQPLPVTRPDIVTAANDLLATRLNDGWGAMNIATTATFNHGTGQIEIVRVVTLQKVKDSGLDGLIAEAAAIIAENAHANAPLIDEEPVGDEVPEIDEVPVPVTARRVVRGEMMGVPEPRPVTGRTGRTGRRTRRVRSPAAATERVPVDEVGFAAALASGRYTGTELNEIGHREAVAAGVAVFFKRQQERNGSDWSPLTRRISLSVGAG